MFNLLKLRRKPDVLGLGLELPEAAMSRMDKEVNNQTMPSFSFDPTHVFVPCRAPDGLWLGLEL